MPHTRAALADPTRTYPFNRAADREEFLKLARESEPRMVKYTAAERLALIAEAQFLMDLGWTLSEAASGCKVRYGTLKRWIREARENG